MKVLCRSLGRIHLAYRYDGTCSKLARYKNHSIFNLRCKKLQLIPPSLRVSCPVRTREGFRIADRAGHAFVRERLKCSERQKRKLEEDRKWTEIGLRRQMGDEVFERFDQLTKKKTEQVFVLTRETQKRKLEALVEEKRDKHNSGKRGQATEVSSGDKERWVINCSEHKLTDDETTVLQKGLNFAPAPRRIPRIEIISSIESTLKDCSNITEAELARSKIAGLLRKAQLPTPNISKAEAQAMAGLKKNNNIVIAAADVGGWQLSFTEETGDF